MSYRNKTYVAFASEDIKQYWMMKAWRENTKIEFDFFDAHDIFQARDSSKPESIKAQLRERIKNAKQIVLLGSSAGKKKGGDGTSFLAYEVGAALRLNLPVVVANLDGGRKVDRTVIPKPFLDAEYYTVSVSFQPAIIKHALDSYTQEFTSSGKTGPQEYNASVYKNAGI